MATVKTPSIATRSARTSAVRSKTPGAPTQPPAAQAAKRTVARKTPTLARTAEPDKAAAATVPAAAAAPETKAQKAPKREKPVRDGFTMPAADFALIGMLKRTALSAGREAKKSELLRAGLHALVALSGAQLKAALDALSPVKTGRPRKGH